MKGYKNINLYEKNPDWLNLKKDSVKLNG